MEFDFLVCLFCFCFLFVCFVLEGAGVVVVLVAVVVAVVFFAQVEEGRRRGGRQRSQLATARGDLTPPISSTATTSTTHPIPRYTHKTPS